MSFKGLFAWGGERDMTKLNLYWKQNRDWWEYKDCIPVMREDAPIEAKLSYSQYVKQRKELDRRTRRFFVIPKSMEGVDQFEESDPDWSRGTHETKELIVFSIPYNEFCSLRDEADIEDYFEIRGNRIDECDTKKLLNDIECLGLSVPYTISTLEEVLRYKTFVYYVEEHIL